MKKSTILTSRACVWALMTGLTAVQAPAMAQTQAQASSAQVRAYDIPAQDLNRALLDFAQSSELQLVYDADWVRGRRSGALKGRYTPAQALERLLDGTGIGYSLSGGRVVLNRAGTGGSLTLGTIRVEGAGGVGEAGDKAPAAYVQGDGVNIGVSTISREAIEARQPGNGDVNQVLKILPHVYFSNNEGTATREDIQDLRPSALSISGGQPYENSFILDGVAANSRIDTVTILATSTAAAHYDNTAGASAETLWVDSSLVDSLVVHDSNVSARYGAFTGGVVEINTRAPRLDYGASLHISCTNNSLVSFKIDARTREALGDNVPAEPDYEKCRKGVSVDLPINERLRVLAGYSQSTAEVTYYKNANYGGGPYGLKSESENILLKLEADLPRDLLLTAQYSYTPYEQEYEGNNLIDAKVHTKGGGKSGKLGLKNTAGDTRWTLDLTYAKSDTSREAPGVFYSWPTAIIGDLCASTSCSVGGWGDIEQYTTDINLKGTFTRPVGPGAVSGGFDFGHTEVSKSRKEDHASYRLYTSTALDQPDFRRQYFVGSSILCANDDPICVPGVGLLNNRQVYPAYGVKVKTDSYALWGEYDFTHGNLDIRAGLRYDRESVLDNDNFAPRLTVSYGFPWAKVTFGANRYYHQSFLGYAVQSATSRTLVYRRTTSQVEGGRLANDWFLYSVSTGYTYDGVALRTPYSDELTLGLTRTLLGGDARVKFISRRYKDQVTRAETDEKATYVDELGNTLTYNIRVPANGGKSEYDGVSLEWARNFGRHTISLSGNWAETKTNIDIGDAYMDYSGDYSYDGDLVYYEGEVRPLLAVIAENGRLDFASPGLANANWSAHWFGGRLKTNLNARWRASFDQIEDTGVNVRIDGVSYDEYAVVHYDDSVSFNGGLDAEIVRRGSNVVSIEVRGTNLLDTLPKITGSTSSSQPYRFGRSFWVGLKYRY